jgi:hypothetical protein
MSTIPPKPALKPEVDYDEARAILMSIARNKRAAHTARVNACRALLTAERDVRATAASGDEAAAEQATAAINARAMKILQALQKGNTVN